MKILLGSRFHFDQYKGGAERYAHDIATNLAQDHQVIMATTSDVTSKSHPYQIITYQDKTLSHQPIVNYQLQQIIKLVQPDVFHSIGVSLQYLPAFLFPSKYRKNIVSLLAPSLPKQILYQKINQLQTKLFLSKADAASTLTPFSVYHTHFSQFTQKLFPVSPSLTPSFSTISKKKSSIISSLKLPKSSKIILLVSKLDTHHYYKGVDTSIQAMKYLDQTFRLLVVGSGDKIEHFKNLAMNLGVSKKVSFLGEVSDQELHALYTHSQLLIAPSNTASEGFNMSILEAMANLTPVITTNVVGLAPILKKQRIATIVPANNPKILAVAIQNTANQNHLDLPLIRAKNFALSYNQKKQKKELQKLYQHATS